MSNRLAGLFETQPNGRAALKKMGVVPKGFELYRAEWIDEDLRNQQIMKVTGAVFDGEPSKPDPETIRVAYVSVDEMS